MKTVIGIDPGLKNTGYGIIRIQDNKNVHIAHGVITTRSNSEPGSRLAHIYSEMGELIEKYVPEEAGIESIYFAKNIKTALPVAQAMGVILLAFAQNGIPVSEYSPLEIKNSIAGRGKAEKRQIQALIKIILNLDTVPCPEHAADALAVAVCHIHKSNIRAIIQASGEA